MKVLTVVHQFLPKNVAGTEIYTHALAKALQRRGHDVRLFFSETDPERPHGSVSEGVYDDLAYDRIVCNYRYDDFRASYRNPDVERIFADRCARFRPDVVHVQHLQTHSLRLPALARKRGVPVVMTLAEYALVCPLWGQLIKADRTRCDTPPPEECGACLAGAPHFAELLAGRDATAEIAAWRATVARLHEDVDVFVAPSRFLRERFLRFGFPAERLRYCDYGFNADGYERARTPRGSGDPVRFGYIGSWVPYKGVHLLPEAFGALEFVPGWTLDLHGNPGSLPDYARPILEAAERSERMRFRGPFPPDEVARILDTLDVVIVPSIWYENSPLTIHEAFLAGLPVVTSRLGGMAELVTDGVSGLLFEPGDAADLTRVARRLVEEDELHARLRSGIPAVKTIAENASEMEAMFEEVGRARRGRRRFWGLLPGR